MVKITYKHTELPWEQKWQLLSPIFLWAKSKQNSLTEAHSNRSFGYTVAPVLSGPVLSGHPLLSGQLSKSRKLLPLITVILTSIKRSPLLSGRGHPLLSPDELFLLS